MLPNPAKPSKPAPLEEVGEADAIEGRAVDYLRRHGDRGSIDAERRLANVRAEYARRRRERGRSPRTIGGSEWVSLGPTNGAGRMSAVAPVPGSPGAAYAGAAGGGVWRTGDGGATWEPLTEGLHDLSVGALALAPSNPRVVYLGTGEGGIISTFIPGIGFLKSMDGGATWILPPSVLATTFYRILVHPTNADELLAGTNAGAFRSTDGGSTWTNVISRADYGDVPDMVRDPTDPSVVYATTWCVSRNCTNRSARVLRSSDGGVTWTDRSIGLPSPGSGRNERMSIAIASSSPRVLYAARAVRDLVTTGELICHVYKTTDAGTTWVDLPAISGDPNFSQYMGSQASYDNTLVVSPTDSNVVIAGGVFYLRSSDGGATFSMAFSSNPGEVHGDCHDLRYGGSRLWIAHDGGVSTSDDDGRTGAARNAGLVTRQFYALANDPVHRERMIAGSQDNGTVQRLDAGTTWRTIGGADGIQCAIHPLSTETAWISAQGGLIDRLSSAGSATPRLVDVAPPFDEEELRGFFTVVRLDPREPTTLYTSSTRVWRSRDGGETWRPLPTATTDGSAWSDSDTIFSVALPASDSPLMIVAKGRHVFRSFDRGETWTAGGGLPDVFVNQIEIDPRDPLTAYACLATTTGTSLYRSADGGLTWTVSSSGLPAFAAQALRVDPTDSSDLFCGTDVGVFRSLDRGATWTRFGTGLPAASVHDLQISDDGAVVRAATYGRGVWELRVTPSGNSPPTAVVTSPAASLSILAGASVDFAGTVADADAGDAAVGTWYFPDDATFVPLATASGGAGGVVRHSFRRAGSFVVALAARDSRGARSSATVTVDVREPADSCATPWVVPSSGPFPYTLAVDDEAGTPEASDVDSACYPGYGRAGTTWIEFTPAASARYTFSTCTGASTAVSVFTGNACGPYTPVGASCGAIGGGTECGFGTTTVSATLSAGQTYRILLGGMTDNQRAPVSLTVDLGPVSPTGPRVVRMSPGFGPPGGGTDVVITGLRFSSGATVLFDGLPASDAEVLAAGVIAAKSPAHAPGAVDVSVGVAGEGTATLGRGFRYEAIPTSCVPGPTSLCLNGGRFRVTVEWAVAAQGQAGAGQAVPLTSDTGYFWFFSSNNIELVVKVVDGRSFNGKFWVFYGALSNVEYRITVTDSTTGDVRVYSNPSGQLASVADTAAF